ncbi:iron complex outermembrane recepter protein [Mucilaginibacter pineti]|uniref:Iron complex outermembrane recepter protein n=1 Tax=Mucilaginibacter pineti TaxID=1391627 RepID=A0A1G7AGF7_9SPHI|nr:TonB-dependent receptor [Mucilaginibacter pineti]SDE13820.1 iron complex outermembrane recepter protein [Mucilaginibacter pineti]
MKLKLISCLLTLVISFSFASNAHAIVIKNTVEDVAGSLTGTVTDKADGKPIIGATISIPDLHTGAITNADGKYVFNHVPKGVYLIQISYIGYSTFNQKVDLSKTSVFDVVLKASALEAGEVIVTGVSKATEIKRSPVPMVAVGKAYLDQRAASGNIIDQIASLPGVSAVTTGPNVSKPFIHGLGYNRVITLQDGIRQEGQQWGDEHGIEVDQNSIDRIEVIKGPASLTYGSDAIGGVVNLISPAPVPDGKILGSVQGIYGTNQGLLNGSFRLQGNNNGFVWGTVVSAKEAKDYQNQVDGRVFATSYKEKDARLMVGLNKSWGYSYLHASVFDDEQSIPDGSRDSISRKFTRQITEDGATTIVPESELNSYKIPVLHQHVQLYRIYNNSNFILGSGNLIVNLGYQFSHRREYTHPEAGDIAGLNLHLTTYTYDVKYNFNLGNDYETTFGVNGQYQNNTIGDATDFPIPAYHQFDIGPFFVVKKSYGKLDLSAGGRFDIRSFKNSAAYVDTLGANGFPQLYTGSNPTGTPNVISQFDAFSKTFSGFSGSFGATYNVSDAFLFKGNIARGFRAPSIAEISANGPDPGSQIYHIGDRSFKPEFSLQEDLGAFLTLPNISASVEIFNNDISNYIYQQQVLDASGNPVITQGYTTFTYVQSKARIYGGELNVDLHPVSWLHFENAMSLTYGENKGNGGPVADSLKYLPFIPPLHTHSELRGTFNGGFGNVKNLYAFVGFDHYSAQNRFFAAYGTETATPGYNLLSAGFGGNIVNKAGQPVLKLFIEGTNLANVNYQSNMSRLKYFDNPETAPGVQRGIFNMGRNISFKVVVPFGFNGGKKS